MGVRGTLPPCGATGIRLLIGELEALLLQRYSLLEHVRQQYPQATVYMFADAWAKLQSEWLELERRTQRVELEMHLKLMSYLRSEPLKIKLEAASPDVTVDDEQFAEHLGLAIVTNDGQPNTVSLSLIAAYLRAKSAIGSEQARLLGLREGEAPPDSLPSRMVLAYAALIHLMHTEMLSTFVDHVGEAIIIGPEALALVQGRIEELQLVVDAAELAFATVATLRKGISDGWFTRSTKGPKSPISLRFGTPRRMQQPYIDSLL
ncbi:hypothetical protein [Nannocystis pusilla]|uniref:hypothetical protein n=1 Tax=Nannocystis pusilla TaxID=889268 RepID=UPI003B7C43E8